MKARRFNQRYRVGASFIYQPNKILRGGIPVKTIGKAKDLTNCTVVEISIEPYFVRTDYLTPA
ncbi:hypothetical protein PTE_02037 [Photorhabdus khanii NC19]|uniref:Uncharacterized protein n=1 Tax=Photorhabdus khanii NC19 TaxID=1004151 RepID=W3VA64_9GAMM|nr:hypothetical protein [Photorhabdus khanii]ETS31939.1 hypothetical protein PTE_02037 [Photorhabdus khanii NC19]